jgi:hypothetical protein
VVLNRAGTKPVGESYQKNKGAINLFSSNSGKVWQADGAIAQKATQSQTQNPYETSCIIKD